MKSNFYKTINSELKAHDAKIINNVVASINWQQVKSNNAKPRRKFRWSAILAPALAIMLLFVGILVPMLNNDAHSQHSITLSINPQVEINVNDKGIVTSFTPLNADGVKIMLKEDLNGMTLADATTKVVSLANKYGYLTSDKTIRIYATNKNKKVDDDEYANIKKVIDNFVAANSIKTAGVTELTSSEFDDIYKIFDTFDKDKYTQQVEQQLFDKLKEVITNKSTATNDLLATLNTVIIADNEEDLITDTTIKAAIDAYIAKGYALELDEIDLTKLTYGNVAELKKQLNDVAADIADILGDLNKPGDEDSIAERIEEYLELAEEVLRKDTDD